MDRKFNARAIYFVSYVAAIAVAWQSVRFCQGNIGAPGIDQFFSLMQHIVGSQPDTDEFSSSMQGLVVFSGWVNKSFYYLGGVFVWVVLAKITHACGWTLGRIVEVGSDQYRAEVKEAERLAAIENARERRLEKRARARYREAEAKRPKSGFTGTALVIGIVIGVLF